MEIDASSGHGWHGWGHDLRLLVRADHQVLLLSGLSCSPFCIYTVWRQQYTRRGQTMRRLCCWRSWQGGAAYRQRTGGTDHRDQWWHQPLDCSIWWTVEAPVLTPEVRRLRVWWQATDLDVLGRTIAIRLEPGQRLPNSVCTTSPLCQCGMSMWYRAIFYFCSFSCVLFISIVVLTRRCKLLQFVSSIFAVLSLLISLWLTFAVLQVSCENNSG